MKYEPFEAVIRRGNLGSWAELLALGLTQSGCLIATALLLRQMFREHPSVEGADVWWTLSTLALLSVLAALARWRERFAGERLAVAYVHRLRMRLFDVATGARAGRALGVQLVRFSSDLTAFRQWISLGLARGISAAFFLGGILVSLAWLAPILAITVFAILTAGVITAAVIGLQLKSAIQATRTRRSRVANRIADTLIQLPAIMSSGRLVKEQSRAQVESDELGRQQEIRAYWEGALRAAAELTHRLCLVGLIVVITAGVATNPASAAEIMAALALVALIAGPVRDLGRVFEYWHAREVAKTRLAKLFKPELESTDSVESVPDGPGVIRINAGRLCGRLEMPDLTVGPGARVHISGKNGSGKSLLLRAVAGLLDGTQETSTVCLDGVETRSIPDEIRCKYIAIAADDDRLVDGSIEKNIRFSLPGAGVERVDMACRQSGLSLLLSTFPDGLATRLGRGRRSTSSGEKARILLARALLPAPSVLLLDEIDRSMDVDGTRGLKELLVSYNGSIFYASSRAELRALATIEWEIEGDTVIQRHVKGPGVAA